MLIGHAQTQRQLAQNRAHSLLLEGTARIGRRGLARWYAQLLNCSEPLNGQPCGECPSCQNFMAGTHPDYLEVSPKEETSTGKKARSSIIPIAVISRSHDTAKEYELHVLDWLETAPRYRHKVVVIDGASFLNESAANALLKSVEEPPHAARFVFITEDISGVIPTIVSRSVRYRVAPVPELTLERAFPQADPDVLRFAAGRVGLLIEAERVSAQLSTARQFVDMMQADMLEALNAADVLEKSFDRDLTPHVLRFQLQRLPEAPRARADAALERAEEALEGYATPNLVFAHLALEIREALGRSE